VADKLLNLFPQIKVIYADLWFVKNFRAFRVSVADKLLNLFPQIRVIYADLWFVKNFRAFRVSVAKGGTKNFRVSVAKGSIKNFLGFCASMEKVAKKNPDNFRYRDYYIKLKKLAFFSFAFFAF